MDYLREGSLLGGRFRLIEPVGVGRMGAVWRATDEVLDRDVAVKTLAADAMSDPDAHVRFRYEARAAARLSHPAIAAVHDYGEIGFPDGVSVPYIVMEFLPGQTLEARLSGGPLPVDEALLVVAAVADALAAAHRAGVIHRDIKPANIMLTPSGVKVVDFGIAALSDQPLDRPFRGSLAYIAPELADDLVATPAADVYSLGVVFMACVTGVTPRGAVTAPPRPPPLTDSIPPDLAALWGACLGASPQERPTAAHVAAASRQVLIGPKPVTAASSGRAGAADETVPVPRARVPEPEPGARGPQRARRKPPAPRRRVLLLSGALAPVAAGAVAVALLLSAPGARKAGSPAQAPAPASSSALAGPGGPAGTATPAHSATAGTATPGQKPASSPPPPPSASQSPSQSPLSALKQLGVLIQQGAHSGQIRRDVANDFTNIMQPYQASLEAGKPTNVTQLVTTLHAKLTARLSENTITQAEGRVLSSQIDLLAKAAG